MYARTKRMKIAILTGAGLLLGGFGWITTPLSVSATAVDAAGDYKAKCAICHGMDGSGNTTNGKKLNTKDLRRDEAQKMSDAQLLQIILKGKNKMPAYEALLGKDKCAALVPYVRTLKK